MDHRITVCTSCRHTGPASHPGYELIDRLYRSIAMAGEAVPETFETSGTARPGSCERPCTIAYHGTRAAVCLFGDVDPDTGGDALVAFAQDRASARAYGRAPCVATGSAFGGDHAPASVSVLERSGECLS